MICDLYVIRMRLERMTVCLEGRCSIQLSYRTDLIESAKLRVFIDFNNTLVKVG